MPPVEINYFAVLIAAVVNMVIGSFWYSSAGFGRLWMAMIGKTEEEIRAGSKNVSYLYILAFVAALVMSYVLALVIDFAQADTVGEGLSTGFWVWLGFVATVQLGIVLWESKPFKLYLLNTSYYLVSLLIGGIILAVWA
jgi:hypothetical protein